MGNHVQVLRRKVTHLPVSTEQETGQQWPQVSDGRAVTLIRTARVTRDGGGRRFSSECILKGETMAFADGEHGMRGIRKMFLVVLSFMF